MKDVADGSSAALTTAGTDSNADTSTRSPAFRSPFFIRCLSMVIPAFGPRRPQGAMAPKDYLL